MAENRTRLLHQPGLSQVLKTPRRRKRKKLERAIEGPCRADAHALGWVSRKMNGLGFRSWPDRLFLPPPTTPKARARRSGGGRPTVYLQGHQVQPRQRFWVEFKRPGEAPTPAQAQAHRDLRDRGERVYVVDDREAFRRILRAHHDAAVA